MLIVCPNCATSYTVGASALGLAGRNVRCVRCRTQWFAAPPQAAGPASTATFVDEIIAEADAKSAAGTPAPRPAPRPAKSPVLPPATAIPQAHIPQAHAPEARLSGAGLPEATPIAPVESAAPDVTQFGAALDQVSAVTPMRADDVSGDAPVIDAPAHYAEPHIGDAPPIVPPAEPPFSTAEPDDVEHAATRRSRKFRKSRRDRAFGRVTGRRIGRLPLLITLLVATLGAMLIWRNTLVKYVPQTASLFTAIGMPVNVRGLVFEGVTVSRDTNDGVAVLAVEGKIVSTSGAPVDVPRLRFAIRNTTGQEIYTWTAQPPRSILGAGETMTFRSRLAAPPTDGVDVLVRFFNAHDLPGSK
ncbi:MAG: MJ0042-type zinc finger domain-containing protein [Pseudolabrys sp.]